MDNNNDDYIELVGGPFCGAIIEATRKDLQAGQTINTPCATQEKTKQWDHLDAIYKVEHDAKAILVGYCDTEF